MVTAWRETVLFVVVVKFIVLDFGLIKERRSGNEKNSNLFYSGVVKILHRVKADQLTRGSVPANARLTGLHLF